MLTASLCRESRVFDPDCLDCSTTSRGGRHILARRHMVHTARVIKARTESGLTTMDTGFTARLQEIIGAVGTRTWR